LPEQFPKGFGLRKGLFYGIFDFMKLSKWTFGALFAGFATALYILTMMPTVGLIDSGELALACAEPGIAHPTGYPLYTILGRLFVMFTGAEAVVATNLFSAVAGGAAVFALFMIAMLILDVFHSKTRDLVKILLASGIALLFGFSATMWEVSTETEVYALEMAMDFAALFFLLRWWLKKDFRDLLCASFIFGLAFGVHMLTVLFAPAALFILFDGRKNLNLKQLATASVLFAVGLSVYLYLPIRAGLSPYSNFGDPSSWGRFWRHVSGWQYRVWMFDRSGQELVSAVVDFFVVMLNGTAWVGLILGLIGFFAALFVNRKAALVFGLIALSTLLYSLNYSIPDIAPYYLPALACFLLCIAVSGGTGRRFGFLIGVIVLTSALTVGFVNYFRSDRSNYYLAEETATNILALAPQNSVVYLNNWDWYAPAKYLQRTRGYRRDVFLLDYELMRRSWYLEQALANDYHAELAGEAIRAFIENVKFFETGATIDPAILEGKWREMHTQIALANLRSGNPVLGTPFAGELAEIWKTAPKRPVGMLMQIADTLASVKYIPPGLYEIDELLRLQGGMSSREIALVAPYNLIMTRRAEFLYARGYLDIAVEYLKRLTEMNPENYRYYQNIAVIRIEQEQYEKALEVFRKAEHLMPFGSKPEMIYFDLERRIAQRDSLLNQELEDD